MSHVMRVAARLVTPLLCLSAASLAAPPDARTAADLDARRLVGKAYYENDKFAEAAAEFRKCIDLAPDSAVDRFNLGLILMRAQEYDEALRVLAEARQLDPDLLAAHYIEGIIHKRQSRFEPAVESLKHVIARNPRCSGAYYNLGVCYKFLQRYEDAIAAFGKNEELSPTDPSTQYQLITLYRRTGQVDNAERHMEIYNRVKDTVDESEKTAEALERSQYTYIIEAPRLTADLKPEPGAEVRFVEATEQSGLPKPGTYAPALAQIRSSYLPLPGSADPEALRSYWGPMSGSAVALGDYDADGDLDIYVVNASTDPQQAPNRLYRNNGGGKFVDVTAEAGVADPGMGTDAVFGDYDNDGDLDLYVVNCGPNVLYRNKGDGTFEDVSAAARANEPQSGRKALFFDYDHDNDLDIFVANDTDFDAAPRGEPDPEASPDLCERPLPGQSDTLLRNNGNGTFSDQTDAAGLLVGFFHTADAVVADFDGDHDIDLFVGNEDAPSKLFGNARMGRFMSGGSFSPPIPTDPIGVRALAAGDFNRDGHSDLVVAAGCEGLDLYTNDGHAGFSGTPIALPDKRGLSRITVLDYNNDGWNDLLLHNYLSLSLLAGAGKGEFVDVSGTVGLREPPGERFAATADLATGDLDGDGDQDIVVHTLDQGPRILRNDGGNRAHWLNVKLVGKKVNRSGYGATVEIASGGHYQKQTCTDGPVHFGLGDLAGVDVVRVTWPNGVAQNVIKPEINATLTVEEFVKVSASCGFLYAHNGRGFELVNEILGIGPLGVPMAPGVYHQPDCTELTKIGADQLIAKDGAYELRLTEELREITYADRITLRVIDHPAFLEIVPNEYFTAPPFPEDRFYAIGDQHPPRSAVDDRGRNVLDEIRYRDDRFPTFAFTGYDGLARPHSLTLDLGDLSGVKRILLFLDGWIYWPESSVVMAIAQDPRFDIAPLKLEVRDESGAWHTAIESVGLPTSKGLVVPVDLTGRFLCDDHRVRLSTNLCVYFDRVFVSTRDQSDGCRQTELPVAGADLHYRGFSRMTRDALGFERFDYADASPTGSWDPPKGMFTRYGDVTPLLDRPDDRYVIFGPGDELTMRFDATGLPDLPPGWARDFIFYANGWVKDGDLNTRFSGTVEPLPFHAMTGYPYGPDEHYPQTPEHQRYQREYNTRPTRSTVGTLPAPAPLQ
ncbi:MAG TPA: FG-GAP-like repeat-containing protein [Phycisphaerae bacterium]|nr:FG-GAP-like repeat-containing protein [Phycisphaerae bacterium]